MKVRFATIDDKKNFLLIQKEAFPNLNIKKQKEYFIEKVNKKELFVAEKNIYLGHISFSEYKLTPPFIGGAFIEELAVRKAFRKRGIGTALIKKLIKYCKKRNIRILYLGTGDYSKNTIINYYKKVGFMEVGRLKDIDPNSEYKYGQIFLAAEIGNLF